MPHPEPAPEVPLHVVAAALHRADAAGPRILLARRPAHAHQGGRWEFPGGKVEPGETAHAALARELREELGIGGIRARALIRFPYRYPEFRMDFEVFLVSDWDGEAHGREGQEVRWVSPDALRDLDTPPASRPVIRALQLPEHSGITPDPADDQDWEGGLERLLHDGRIRLLQLRAHSLSAHAYRACARDVVARAHRAGAQVLLNAHSDDVAACGADGVHLSRNRLHRLRRRPLPPGLWVAASCHCPEDLARAQEIDADFAVLSRPSKSVPWDARDFAAQVAPAALPVYALGGMRRADCAQVQACGGQGVAAIRDFWQSSGIGGGPDRSSQS